ncbi:MAG: polysaccharide export protein [Gammaproteobacteria bacterium]|nr:MAG: polysaccharide export protein [Gammaproteobacteria bacterium]
MLKRYTSRASPALAILALSACAFLPTSGPSRKEVQTGAGRGIQIVDVNDGVAHRLLESHASRLLSDALSGAPGNSEVVGPGDVLEVSIWEAPPATLFSLTTGSSPPSLGMPSSVVPSNAATLPAQTIASDGTIYVPFAGNTLVTGKSLREIEAEITRKLRGRAHEPQVLVRLIANNTAYVTVVGDVNNSVRMPLTPRGEHLLDALAVAGGTKNPVEKMTLQVTRGDGVYSLPLETVIRDPRQNIPLRAGDVVTALFQPLSFTALGATGKSDEINFEARGISLAQALARAGGLIDNRSNAEGVFIFRFESKQALAFAADVPATPDGRVPVIYRVDLRDPRSFFVAQSFPMENKDVLYIANAPGSELQKFLNLLLSTIYPIDRVITLSK